MKTVAVVRIDERHCDDCAIADDFDYNCSVDQEQRLECAVDREKYVVNKIPEDIDDVKDLLDELKIVYKPFYVNSKDYKWHIEDTIRILRAIVIEFRTKFDDVYTNYSITINNDNEIRIHKYKYEGQDFISIKLSTMEQIWSIFIGIYKDVKKED